MISAKIGHTLDPFLIKIYKFFFPTKIINPDTLTICGLLGGMAASGLVAWGCFYSASVMLLVSGIFDLLDGAIARTTGNATPFGGFLDSVVDRYSDLFIMFGIFAYFISRGDTLFSLVTFFATMGTAVIPYVRARAEASSFRCNTGILERSERLIIIFVGLLTGLLTYAVALLAVLTHVTAIQRIIYVKRESLRRE